MIKIDSKWHWSIGTHVNNCFISTSKMFQGKTQNKVKKNFFKKELGKEKQNYNVPYQLQLAM